MFLYANMLTGIREFSHAIQNSEVQESAVHTGVFRKLYARIEFQEFCNFNHNSGIQASVSLETFSKPSFQILNTQSG